jgi:hypothetical protein
MGCSSTSPASPTSYFFNRAARDVRSRGFGASPCHTIMSLSDSSDCCWPSKRRTACKAPRANPSEAPCLPAYPPRPPHPVLFLTCPSVTRRTATFIRVSESPAKSSPRVRPSSAPFRDFRLNAATSLPCGAVELRGAHLFLSTISHCIAREEVEMRINATR